jgi:hypothetical protein
VDNAASRRALAQLITRRVPLPCDPRCRCDREPEGSNPDPEATVEQSACPDDQCGVPYSTPERGTPGTDQEQRDTDPRARSPLRLPEAATRFRCSRRHSLTVLAHNVKDCSTRRVLVGSVTVVMVMVFGACGGGVETMRPPTNTTSTTGTAKDDARNLACTYAQETLDQVRRSHGRNFEADIERYLAQIADAHDAEQTNLVAAKIQAVQQAVFDLEDADRPTRDVKPAMAALVRAINTLGC